MDWSAIVVAVITGLVSLVGVILANRSNMIKMHADLDKAQAVTNTKLEELTREVRAHNGFAQRMPVVEEKLKVVDHRLEDLEKGGQRGYDH